MEADSVILPVLGDVEQHERGVRCLACGLHGRLLTAEVRIRCKHLGAAFCAVVGWVSSSQTLLGELWYNKTNSL